MNKLPEGPVSQEQMNQLANEMIGPDAWADWLPGAVAVRFLARCGLLVGQWLIWDETRERYYLDGERLEIAAREGWLSSGECEAVEWASAILQPSQKATPWLASRGSYGQAAIQSLIEIAKQDSDSHL